MSSVAGSELETLLSYASRGWRLIPIRSQEKRPIPSEWQRAATANPARIQEWHSQYPDANWGLVLGPESGVIDLECDSPEAEQLLGKLAGGEVPRTPTYKAARGLHRPFRWCDDLPNVHQAVFKIGSLEFRLGGGSKGAQSLIRLCIVLDSI